jgi:hypothetical protein
MNLNDLLRDKDIDPKCVLVFRHRPHELGLRKVLPWLATERPDLFNAYQQTQGKQLETAMKALTGIGYVASFIGHESGKGLFVGLYSIKGTKPLTFKQFWQIPAHVELRALGLRGWLVADNAAARVLRFDLVPTDFYSAWKGKLIVVWPPPERAWWRRAHRNEIPVAAILEDSALDAAMPNWEALDLGWEELGVLPTRWKAALSQWRGVYYIFDTADGKGYVGSASGESNLLGRWLNYAASGHGGNRQLRQRDPRTFRFTILQRVSPDLDASDVVRIENSWKQRLHTRTPHGLNDN